MEGQQNDTGPPPGTIPDGVTYLYRTRLYPHIPARYLAAAQNNLSITDLTDKRQVNLGFIENESANALSDMQAWAMKIKSDQEIPNKTSQIQKELESFPHLLDDKEYEPYDLDAFLGNTVSGKNCCRPEPELEFDLTSHFATWDRFLHYERLMEMMSSWDYKKPILNERDVVAAQLSWSNKSSGLFITPTDVACEEVNLPEVELPADQVPSDLTVACVSDFVSQKENGGDGLAAVKKCDDECTSKNMEIESKPLSESSADDEAQEVAGNDNNAQDATPAKDYSDRRTEVSSSCGKTDEKRANVSGEKEVEGPSSSKNNELVVFDDTTEESNTAEEDHNNISLHNDPHAANLVNEVDIGDTTSLVPTEISVEEHTNTTEVESNLRNKLNDNKSTTVSVEPPSANEVVVFEDSKEESKDNAEGHKRPPSDDVVGIANPIQEIDEHDANNLVTTETSMCDHTSMREEERRLLNRVIKYDESPEVRVENWRTEAPREMKDLTAQASHSMVLSQEVKIDEPEELRKEVSPSFSHEDMDVCDDGEEECDTFGANCSVIIADCKEDKDMSCKEAFPSATYVIPHRKSVKNSYVISLSKTLNSGTATVLTNSTAVEFINTAKRFKSIINNEGSEFEDPFGDEELSSIMDEDEDIDKLIDREVDQIYKEDNEDGTPSVKEIVTDIVRASYDLKKDLKLSPINSAKTNNQEISEKCCRMTDARNVSEATYNQSGSNSICNMKSVVHDEKVIIAPEKKTEVQIAKSSDMLFEMTDKSCERDVFEDIYTTPVNHLKTVDRRTEQSRFGKLTNDSGEETSKKNIPIDKLHNLEPTKEELFPPRASDVRENLVKPKVPNTKSFQDTIYEKIKAYKSFQGTAANSLALKKPRLHLYRENEFFKMDLCTKPVANHWKEELSPQFVLPNAVLDNWTREEKEREDKLPIITRNMKEPELTKKVRSQFRTFHIDMDETHLELLKSLENYAQPLLKELQNSGALPMLKSFKSLHPDVTRYILNQQAQSRQRGMVYCQMLALHGVVKAADCLLHCSIATAQEMLQEFQNSHKTFLKNGYAPVLNNMSKMKQHGIHPKLTTLIRELDDLSPGTSGKVLIVLKRYKNTLSPSIERDLPNVTCMTFLTDDPMSREQVLGGVDGGQVLIISPSNIRIQEEFPWERFSVLVDYEPEPESLWEHLCREHNIEYWGFKVAACWSLEDEIEQPTKKEEEGGRKSEDKEGIKTKTSTIKKPQITIIVSEAVSRNADLLMALEEEQNILVVSRDYMLLREKVREPRLQFADVVVDERTAVLLATINAIDSETTMERIDGISSKFSWCMVMICTGENTIAEIKSASTKLHQYLEAQKLTNACNVNTKFTRTTRIVAESIRFVADKAMTTSDRKDWLDRSWMTDHVTEEESMLLQVPCLNSYTAQLMLTTAPLELLQTLSVEQLIYTFPWLPMKVAQSFWSYIHPKQPEVGSGQKCHSFQYNDTPMASDVMNRSATSEQLDAAFKFSSNPIASEKISSPPNHNWLDRNFSGASQTKSNGDEFRLSNGQMGWFNTSASPSVHNWQDESTRGPFWPSSSPSVPNMFHNGIGGHMNPGRHSMPYNEIVRPFQTSPSPSVCQPPFICDGRTGQTAGIPIRYYHDMASKQMNGSNLESYYESETEIWKKITESIENRNPEIRRIASWADNYQENTGQNRWANMTVNQDIPDEMIFDDDLQEYSLYAEQDNEGKNLSASFQVPHAKDYRECHYNEKMPMMANQGRFFQALAQNGMPFAPDAGRKRFFAEQPDAHRKLELRGSTFQENTAKKIKLSFTKVPGRGGQTRLVFK